MVNMKSARQGWQLLNAAGQAWLDDYTRNMGTNAG